MAKSQRPKVALVQRHYLPDVPTYCELSHGIAVELATENHVEVFTTSPSYKGIYEGPEPPAKEELDGVLVHRLSPPQRLPAMAGFAIEAARSLRKREFDVVIVVSEPPVVLPFVTLRAAGSAKTIQVLQDIHPEAGVVAGLITNPLALKALTAMDKWTARAADRTVVLSEDMANTYGSSRSPSDLRVINNYRLESPSSPPPAGLIDPDKFNVTFAGNIGKFQNVDVLVDAANLVSASSNVVFHIVGSGSEEERIRERVVRENVSNVLVHGRLSRASAQGFMEQSDVGVITLEREIHKYSFPSKTMAYIDAGCRLLAIVEPHSSLAADIQEHGLGEVAEPEAASVAAAVAALIASPIVSPAVAPYGRRETLLTWRELVSELV